MSDVRRVLPEAGRRGWCPSLGRPMPTGDGLLARVHPPLGCMSVAQLRAVADGARRFGNGHVDVTARGNLQIRGVRGETAEPLAIRLTRAGLGDVRTDGGPQRLTLTSPLAGLDPAETVDVPALARAVEAAGLAISGLPAKTLVAFAGIGVTGEDADVVVQPAGCGRVAIALAGGDGMSVEVAGGAAADAVTAVLHAFAATGRRRVRDLLLGDRAKLHQACETATRGYSPPPSAGEGGPSGASCVSRGRERGAPSFPEMAVPAPLPPAPQAPTPAEGGGFALAALLQNFTAGLANLGDLPVLAIDAPFGRCTAAGLDRLAETALALGRDDIRTTPNRGFLLRCDTRAAGAAALDRLAEAGFITRPDDPRRAVAACPGAPACASGSTPVTEDAARLAQAFAPFAERGMTAHVSGCTKGCAHPGPADLTLVGEAGRYRAVAGGSAGEAAGPRLTFEAALDRVRRADPAASLAQAFGTERS